VASGFGERGIEGKIKAVQNMQEKIIFPFFLGILSWNANGQVIEFSRKWYWATRMLLLQKCYQHRNPVINLME